MGTVSIGTKVIVAVWILLTAFGGFLVGVSKWYQHNPNSAFAVFLIGACLSLLSSGLSAMVVERSEDIFFHLVALLGGVCLGLVLVNPISTVDPALVLAGTIMVGSAIVLGTIRFTYPKRSVNQS